MLLYLLMAVVITLTIGALLLPLFKGSAESHVAAQHNLEVYKDQLAELERDVEAGSITASEKDAASLEIKRRMLTALRQSEKASQNNSTSRSDLMIAALIGIVPLCAGLVYLMVGRPDMGSFAFTERADIPTTAAPVQSADGSHPEMQDLIATLATRLQQSPDDLEGWVLLARSLVNNGQYAESLPAWQEAIRLTEGRSPQVAAEYAETLVMANEGIVNAEARSIFEKLLEADENDFQALFYLGLADAQSGNEDSAIARWERIIRTSPAGAPWLPTVQQRLSELTGEVSPSPSTGSAIPGPTQADIAAAQQLAPEQQSAMIEGMVSGLAAKLEENPDDLEGWRRIARAYQVLGRTEDEKDALKNIVRLAPDDLAARGRLSSIE